MTYRDTFVISDGNTEGTKISLLKPISAIQVLEDGPGGAKLGLLGQLGAGTTVECCGGGFNERTMKVRTGHQIYFVFVQDLELQAQAAAAG